MSDKLQIGLNMVEIGQAVPFINAPRWQPIETAPKDGSEFLAYGPEMNLWQVVDYDPSERDPAWCWQVVDGCAYHESVFTHWMPLPEPPTSKT